MGAGCRVLCLPAVRSPRSVTGPPMRDVQSEIDHRGLPLEAVGVAGVRLPVVAFRQPTVAELALSVAVAAEQRGTHMSRLVEALHRYRESMTWAGALALVTDVAQRLQTPRVELEARFPYFLTRSAPVSGAGGLLDIDVVLHALHQQDSLPRLSLTVRVPVQSLCPCSKAVSDYGAHNQRGHVEMVVEPASAESSPSIEELVGMAEAAASAPIYPVLKRTDERHITMLAYDNPAFVEDMARGVASSLRSEERVASFVVRVVNQESIHNHQAVAVLRSDPSGAGAPTVPTTATTKSS